VEESLLSIIELFCVNDISQTEIHRAGGLCVEVEVAIEMLIRYK